MVMYVTVCLVLVTLVLFETGLLPQGYFAADKELEFIVVSIMELQSICLIPLALRLFKFRYVADDLKARGERALKKWGILRMDMLCIPMFLNVFFYELFLTPAFGYMAIIFAISLVFVLPTKSRCENELS